MVAWMAESEVRDRIKSPDIRLMFDYWAGLARAERLPGRADIDPLDFPKLLPRVALIDVIDEEEPVHFRYRLAGTEIVERAGRDPTGKRFDGLYVGAYLDQALETYRAVVAERQPYYSRRVFPLYDGREHLIYSRLILPLAVDGTHVDMLLLVVSELATCSSDDSVG